MDILDFDNPELYFDETLPPEVDRLLSLASEQYGTPQAKVTIGRARDLAPHSLTVLVAQFRFQYYQHRVSSARDTSVLAMEVVRQRLGIEQPADAVGVEEFAHAFSKDPAAARFLLHAFKSMGYLSLRLSDWDTAIRYLQAVVRLDDVDRLHCASLLKMARDHQAEFLRTSVKSPVAGAEYPV